MENIIVGLGEALWDVMPDGKKIGGAPANFAYHASQFGNKGYVVSAVGRDELGDGIIEAFQERNLGLCISRVDFPTGTVLVSLDERGVPCYDIKEGAAWDNIPVTEEADELARRTTAVCFGSLAQRSSTSRMAIRRFLDHVPNEGTLKIFDINLRLHYYSREIIEDSLRLCNILKINDDELKIIEPMFGYSEVDVRSLCEKMIADYGLKAMIVTCGEKGSYVASASCFNYEATPKVAVSDTVGAGDSFTGAFCAALLAGKSLEEAHRLAVKVSAFVCTQSGAMPVLPDELKF